MPFHFFDFLTRKKNIGRQMPLENRNQGIVRKMYENWRTKAVQNRVNRCPLGVHKYAGRIYLTET
jgi:hypothetical protein